jgi:hypothetical protein
MIDDFVGSIVEVVGFGVVAGRRDEFRDLECGRTEKP